MVSISGLWHLITTNWPTLLFILNIYLYFKTDPEYRGIVGALALFFTFTMGFSQGMVAWLILNILTKR